MVSVYPRVCGGTPTAISTGVASEGLSPRVRGNRHLYRNQQHLYRSIPACAGEPGQRGKRWVDDEVYPRVCGGTMGDLDAGDNNFGLSPRVRGNRTKGFE